VLVQAIYIAVLGWRRFGNRRLYPSTTSLCIFVTESINEFNVDVLSVYELLIHCCSWHAHFFSWRTKDRNKK